MKGDVEPRSIWYILTVTKALSRDSIYRTSSVPLIPEIALPFPLAPLRQQPHPGDPGGPVPARSSLAHHPRPEWQPVRRAPVDELQ